MPKKSKEEMWEINTEAKVILLGTLNGMERTGRYPSIMLIGVTSNMLVDLVGIFLEQSAKAGDRLDYEKRKEAMRDLLRVTELGINEAIAHYDGTMFETEVVDAKTPKH